MRPFIPIVLSVIFTAAFSIAGINNWQTGEVIVGTEEINPSPEMNLAYWNNEYGLSLEYADLAGYDLNSSLFMQSLLSHADFSDSNLSYSNFRGATLSSSSFQNANLTNVQFHTANIIGASFTDSIVNGAGFGVSPGPGTVVNGLTISQLYSTKSYKDKDISRIGLAAVNLSGADFNNQNLSNADLGWANLTNVNFTDSTINGISLWNVHARGLNSFKKEQFYSTKSYKEKDLSGIFIGGNNFSYWDFTNQNLTASGWERGNITGADLSNSNLTRAYFSGTNLTGVDFTDAIVNWATFNLFGGATSSAPSITKEQLYTTKSYKNKDLSGIAIVNNDLSDWNFQGQNLTRSQFGGSILTGADFSFSDMRGAYGWGGVESGAILNNTIETDGQIEEINLVSGEELIIRNFPMAITVRNSFKMSEESMLKILLSHDDWQSTIYMSNGVLPELGGILFLYLNDEIEWVDFLGKQFKLFDWNGQLDMGVEFESILTIDGVEWDLDNLYTDGTVVLTAIPEPATLSLLALGLLSLRKRRS